MEGLEGADNSLDSIVSYKVSGTHQHSKNTK